MDSRESDSMIIDIRPKEAAISHPRSKAMASAAASNRPPASYITIPIKLELVEADQLTSMLIFEKEEIGGDKLTTWSPSPETGINGSWGILDTFKNAPAKLDMAKKTYAGSITFWLNRKLHLVFQICQQVKVRSIIATLFPQWTWS